MAEIATAPSIEVTVVLMGQGDADYRTRAQHYYQQAGIPCLALEPLPPLGTGEAYRESLHRALQSVTTPFVVLSLETDFVLAAALQAASQYLHERPRTIAAQGYALGYRVGNAQVRYHKLGSPIPPLEDDTALARLRQYGHAERQAWRAVMRVSTLQAVLTTTPVTTEFTAFRLGLSYALLSLGAIDCLEQTDVLCACGPNATNLVAHDEQLNQALRDLRQWDSEHQALCAGDTGYAVFSRFVRGTFDLGDTPLLFTSTWSSVLDDPERLFEPRQFVEMPYYNKALFEQMTALEFLCHAWPAGEVQHQALEGRWVRQHHLAQVHPNDTPESLQLRHWQALGLGLFDPQVCRRLLDTLTGPGDMDRARELSAWLERLAQIPGIDRLPRLQATVSGRLLAALEAGAPDAAARQQVAAYLAKRPAAQIAFIVLDLGNDDMSLQSTFDSLLSSGIRDFKLVVLKGGKPPVITTARDTLHFIQVNDDNWVGHLNQVVRQLSSEWLMLLQAGDELLAGGLLHLLVELAAAPACQAVCANEVQRDEEGRLHAVVRPGADLDLLRSQAGLMSRHWLMRRQAVLDLGYSDSYRQALELDLLLRLVETQGVGCLAHLDDFLVIGSQSSPAMLEEASKVLNRHLTQLGYRAQIREHKDGLTIDYRHAATPMVSILLASEGDQERLLACLSSVLQRTRYPRYEVLVVGDEQTLVGLQHLGGRVRLVPVEAGAPRSALLNLAASEARGDYLVLLSERCQVITPAWIEQLLNEAQRPEVGVVGALLQADDGALLHAGYALLEGPRLVSPWQGLSAEIRTQERWSLAARSCAAVSGDCLMVRADVFQHCGGLQLEFGADIDLCLAAAEAGQLVIWTPHAQLLAQPAPAADASLVLALQARWPGAFVGHDASASPLAWLERLQ
ncbi:glycosyltransferase [Pseudomonas guariconensis]|uniref:glycosyltransferase n=2 Tax=Gammaproteobacteria TaxID=1236 RepID=UPI00300D9324